MTAALPTVRDAELVAAAISAVDYLQAAIAAQQQKKEMRSKKAQADTEAFIRRFEAAKGHIQSLLPLSLPKAKP